VQQPQSRLRDLEEVADSNTLREYVNQALPSDELSAQEEQANLALAECIPKSMARQMSKNAEA